MASAKKFSYKMVMVTLLLVTGSTTLTTGQTRNQKTPIVVPVEQLREGRQVIGATNNFINDFPPWINFTLLEIGQKYLAKNFFGFTYGLSLSTFLAGLEVDTRRILISGGNPTELDKAMKGYIAISLHLSYWSTANLSNPVELSSVWETLNLIHSIHGKVGHEAALDPEPFSKPILTCPTEPGSNPYNLDYEAWTAFEADINSAPQIEPFKSKPIFPPKSGGTKYYLNQFTMAMQHWALVFAPIVSPKSVLFYDVTDESLWGYLHYWAFIGRGLGIDDKFNICLQPDLKSAKIYLRRILNEYILPALFELDYEYKVVSEVGVKSLINAFPVIDFRLAIHRICLDILHIKCPRVKALMSPKGRFYEALLERLGHPLLDFDLYQRTLKFILNGMIQVPTIKYFNFNPMLRQNFTNGLIELDKVILRTTSVKHFSKMNKAKDRNINNETLSHNSL